jgi:hypothetical protein
MVGAIADLLYCIEQQCNEMFCSEFPEGLPRVKSLASPDPGAEKDSFRTTNPDGNYLTLR